MLHRSRSACTTGTSYLEHQSTLEEWKQGHLEGRRLLLLRNCLCKKGKPSQTSHTSARTSLNFSSLASPTHHFVQNNFSTKTQAISLMESWPSSLSPIAALSHPSPRKTWNNSLLIVLYALYLFQHCLHWNPDLHFLYIYHPHVHSVYINWTMCDHLLFVRQP